MEPRVQYGPVEGNRVSLYRCVSPEEDDVRPEQRRAEERLVEAREGAVGDAEVHNAAGEGDGDRSERTKGPVVRRVHGRPIRKDKVPAGFWYGKGDGTKQSGEREA